MLVDANFDVLVFRLNFSDMEIEIFCSTFDTDGNAKFTLDEIADIEQGAAMSHSGDLSASKSNSSVAKAKTGIFNQQEFDE